MSDQHLGTIRRYTDSDWRVVAESSIPPVTILSDKKVKIIQVLLRQLTARRIPLTLAGGEVLDYNIIILGLGVVTNYFGIPGMENFSYSIKSFDAIAVQGTSAQSDRG